MKLAETAVKARYLIAKTDEFVKVGELVEAIVDDTGRSTTGFDADRYELVTAPTKTALEAIAAARPVLLDKLKEKLSAVTASVKDIKVIEEVVMK